MKKELNILICPLEWGLGHAGRVIPIAARLREMNHRIFFGAGREHLAFLRKEMPGSTFIDFPGFKPGYSAHLPQYLIILLKAPLLLFHVIQEHIRLRGIIRRYSIDIVVSDNRFGLWNSKIKSVYITHLPLIPFPGAFSILEFTGILLHRSIIKKYSFCFIPDLPGEINVSGRLSHGIKLPANVRFIGILSRFLCLKDSKTISPVSFRHNTVILSGPEPQKGILRKKLTEVLITKELPSVMLGGNPEGGSELIVSGKIVYTDHPDSSVMREIITGSECIITRSGYTSIMELISLGRTALLIPTPGQTEQEYLAGYLESKGWFSTISQDKIDDKMPMPTAVTEWKSDIVEQSRALLDKALMELSEE